MAVLRKAQCDVCSKEEYERGMGAGWPNWIIIQGVTLDGVDNPMLCEDCRNPVMDFIDNTKQRLVK